MQIYKYENYRQYLSDVIQSRPNNGRGEIAKMAKFLNVHATLMSLILSGKREPSVEQAYDLCEYLELSENEKEYFLLLCGLAKAGNPRLRNHLLKKIQKIQIESLQVKTEAKKNSHILQDEDKAIFYSSWLYSAVRLFCSTSEQGKTFDEIQNRFRVNRERLIEIIQFLLQCHLLEEKNGHYLFQTQRTFLEYGSPFLVKHQLNWRSRAMNKVDQVSKEELMVTSPVSISKKDFQKVKAEILDLVSKASQIVKDSNAEEVACLNIDFFWVD